MIERMQATSGLGLIYASACGAGTRREGQEPQPRLVTGATMNNDRVSEGAGWGRDR